MKKILMIVFLIAMFVGGCSRNKTYTYASSLFPRIVRVKVPCNLTTENSIVPNCNYFEAEDKDLDYRTDVIRFEDKTLNREQNYWQNRTLFYLGDKALNFE